MNAINPILPHGADSTGATNGTGSSNSSLPTSQGLNDMFLQLLVAQLQNQSPLNPMDPTQFVGQLAQFSELSEVTQINQTLQQAIASTGSKPTPGAHSVAADSDPARSTAPASVPAAIVSAAVSAAQSAMPNFNSPAGSILNHQIQGVF